MLFRRSILVFKGVMVVVAGLVLLRASLVTTAACFAEAIFEE